MRKHDGIIEFTVAQGELNETLARVEQKTQGRCIIGTKPLGTQVLVSVLTYSLGPAEQASLLQELQETTQVHNYSEGAAPAELEL